MRGANGSRERAPDDKLRDTHHVSMHAQQSDGFRKGSTHPTSCFRNQQNEVGHLLYCPSIFSLGHVCCSFLDRPSHHRTNIGRYFLSRWIWISEMVNPVWNFGPLSGIFNVQIDARFSPENTATPARITVTMLDCTPELRCQCTQLTRRVLR